MKSSQFHGMMFCEIIATNTKYYIFHVVVFIQFKTVNTIKHKLFVFLFTFVAVFEIYSMLGYDVEFGLIILIFVDFPPTVYPVVLFSNCF